MKLHGTLVYFALLSAFLFGCSQKSEVEKQLEDIDKVIVGIEDRYEFEDRIITEATNALKILQENLESANSDGMREKVMHEIRLKESVIEKSRNNRENQVIILEELQVKKDSLTKILEAEQN